MPDNNQNRDWQVERLSSRHERALFSCGEGSLDDFLRHRAGQYDRRNVGRTYVATRPDDPQVLGCFSMG
jgi:hypothetical protein